MSREQRLDRFMHNVALAVDMKDRLSSFLEDHMEVLPERVTESDVRRSRRLASMLEAILAELEIRIDD